MTAAEPSPDSTAGGVEIAITDVDTLSDVDEKIGTNSVDGLCLLWSLALLEDILGHLVVARRGSGSRSREHSGCGDGPSRCGLNANQCPLSKESSLR